MRDPARTNPATSAPGGWRGPRVLLLGATGQIGWELARLLPPEAQVIAPPRHAVDLEDTRRLRDAVRDVRPDCVVNAAAFTDVDRAETDAARAFAINALGPEVLANEAARLGALLVHYSTDYVFDGRSGVPYQEDAPRAPLNVYGESKSAGERAVVAAGGPALVLRTSWVYGTRRSNFLLTMLRLAREPGRVIQVVNDQVGAPTHCRQVAAATADILERLWDGRRFAPGEERVGVFHLSAAGSATWYDFAKAVLEGDPAAGEHRYSALVPVSTDEYGTRARRPRYSILDNTKIHRALGVHQPGWREQLQGAWAAWAQPPSRWHAPR